MTATVQTALNPEISNRYCPSSGNDLLGNRIYDYGFRDYSPVAMRFTTVDPIRSGSNWYSYVSNDPINLIDPWGLREEWYGVTNGGFGADYSNEPNANVDKHLGDDEGHMTNGIKDTSGTTVRAPETLTNVRVDKYKDVRGTVLRGETADGATYSFMHLGSTNLPENGVLEKGQKLGEAGSSGNVDPHLHTAKYYPLNSAPESAGEVIQKYNRDYVKPKTQAELQKELEQEAYNEGVKRHDPDCNR